MKIGKENEILEFKKSSGELKEGIISIGAILNKHKSGELYFGIRNDGLAVGQDVTEKTLRDISQAISNHIEPKIFPHITHIVIENQNCIHVKFEGNNVPYFAYGRAYMRVADEDRIMTPKELESYILKRSKITEKWDTEIAEGNIEDINEDILKNFLERANVAGRVNYAFTNKKDILNKLGLLKGEKVNNSASVLFSENAKLEIQMAIFATSERLTFNDIQRRSGNVFELIETAEKYIKNNIKWRVELDGSIHRKEVPEVPLDAIREAIVNSFCHRDYRVSQNNEVTIFKDRIEIYNPGAFPEGLIPNDFIEGSERSIKRNPQIAQMLYYSKDVESFGTGLRRITATCKAADVKVAFQMLKTGFAVVFYRSENLKADKPPIKADKPPIKADKKPKVISNLDKIIEYSKNNDYLTNKTVREIIGCSESTAKRLLKSLVEKNILSAVGELKTRKYFFSGGKGE